MAFMDALVQPILTYVVDPLLRQFGYIVHAKKNIEKAKNTMDDLRAMEMDVKREVQAAKREGKESTNMVHRWLQKVSDAKDEVTEITVMYDNKGCRIFGDCSLNCWSTYNVSRKAEKLHVFLMELKCERPSSEASAASAPPDVIREIPSSTKTVGLMPYIENVRNFLEDDKVSIIGIWGMGGVGKSTLLETINNDLLRCFSKDGRKLLFAHVIWAVVSQEFTVEKLQKDIAKHMKLPIGADSQENSLIIFDYLKDKDFLLLLDDLWKALDLKVIGIPNPCSKVAVDGYKRKVIFTTRLESVCGQMGAKSLKLECLDSEDAWHLFRKNVGEETISSHPMIENVAKEITRECRGLPLALTVVGRRMATRRDLRDWQYSLISLRKSQPNTSIPDVDDSLFHVLKFSYDGLRNDTLRECFLSCSLWPKDYNIKKETLITCWVGLGLIEDFDDINEVYDQGHHLLGDLQESCLLEHGFDEGRVKMHNMIRDLALWIASGCGKNKYEWVSKAGVGANALKGIERWTSAKRVSIMLNELHELPTGLLPCPNLAVLMLNENKIRTIPEDYFQCLTSLTYLDISHTHLAKLPGEISLLVQLKYLNLSYTRIKSLPIQLRQLDKLEHLLLRGNFMKSLPHELISSLSLLRVLDVFLTTSIDRSSVYFLRPKLKALGTCVYRIETLHTFIDLPIRWLSMENLEGSTNLDLQLLGSMAKLYLHELYICDCNSLEELKVAGRRNSSFLSLQVLRLLDLPKLQMINWEGADPAACLQNLRHLAFNFCTKLNNVTWVLRLPCLVSLHIISCMEMECIIGDEENEFLDYNENAGEDAFASLQHLYLYKLPSLVSICKRALLFPSLKEVEIYRCENLKRLPFQEEMAADNRSLQIYASASWWEALLWDDESIKSTITPYFREKYE